MNYTGLLKNTTYPNIGVSLDLISKANFISEVRFGERHIEIYRRIAGSTISDKFIKAIGKNGLDSNVVAPIIAVFNSSKAVQELFAMGEKIPAYAIALVLYVIEETDKLDILSNNDFRTAFEAGEMIPKLYVESKLMFGAIKLRYMNMMMAESKKRFIEILKFGLTVLAVSLIYNVMV